MKCYFSPCDFTFEPVTIRIDPADASRTREIVPMHEITSGPGWTGMCPASLMGVPGPSAQEAEQLRTALGIHEAVKETVERRDASGDGEPGVPPGEGHEDSGEACPACAAAGRVVQFINRLELIRHMARDHNLDVRADSSAPPGGHIDSFFPIRPAETDDTSELGNGHKPHGPNTMKSGGFAVDDRSGLKASLELAANAAAEAQIAAAAITGHLEQAAASLEVMAAEHQQAAALLTMAVGSSAAEELPDSARDALFASQRLAEQINDERGKLQILQPVNDAAHKFAGRVSTEARAYAATF